MRNAKNTHTVHAILSKMRKDSKRTALDIEESRIDSYSEYRAGDKVWLKKTCDIKWHPGIVVNISKGRIHGMVGDIVRPYSTEPIWKDVFGLGHLECIRRTSDQLPEICKKILADCVKYDVLQENRKARALAYLSSI